jgi:hypothetical protein
VEQVDQVELPETVEQTMTTAKVADQSANGGDANGGHGGNANGGNVCKRQNVLAKRSKYIQRGFLPFFPFQRKHCSVHMESGRR